LDSNLSISDMLFKFISSKSLTLLSSIIEETISCLLIISFFSTNGNAIQLFNLLDPILVIVSSIVSERLNPFKEF
mgnify:CR=1